MNGTTEGGQCIEGMGKDIVVLFIMAWLVPHEFLRVDPAAVCRFAFQTLWTKKETEGEIVVGVFVLVLFDDDDHRAVVVVAVAEGFLAVFQLFEIVYAPVHGVDIDQTVHVLYYIFERLKEVRTFRTEVAAGQDMEEGHRQHFAIAPLEVIYFVQTRSAAPFNLKEKLCPLAHNLFRAL